MCSLTAHQQLVAPQQSSATNLNSYNSCAGLVGGVESRMPSKLVVAAEAAIMLPGKHQLLVRMLQAHEEGAQGLQESRKGEGWWAV